MVRSSRDYSKDSPRYRFGAGGSIKPPDTDDGTKASLQDLKQEQQDMEAAQKDTSKESRAKIDWMERGGPSNDANSPDPPDAVGYKEEGGA